MLSGTDKHFHGPLGQRPQLDLDSAVLSIAQMEEKNEKSWHNCIPSGPPPDNRDIHVVKRNNLGSEPVLMVMYQHDSKAELSQLTGVCIFSSEFFF